MRFSSSNPKAAILQRRERWRRDHAAALTIGSAYPQVERIGVDLSFSNAAVSTPVPQSHALHPAAQAFFDFPCPYADCDGHFDLNAVVAQVLGQGKTQVSGRMDCQGVRLRGVEGKQPCLLRADYIISVHYREKAAAAKTR